MTVLTILVYNNYCRISKLRSPKNNQELHWLYVTNLKSPTSRRHQHNISQRIIVGNFRKYTVLGMFRALRKLILFVQGTVQNIVLINALLLYHNEIGVRLPDGHFFRISNGAVYRRRLSGRRIPLYLHVEYLKERHLLNWKYYQVRKLFIYNFLFAFQLSW